MSGKLKNNSYSLVLPSSMEVEFTLTLHKTFVSSSTTNFSTTHLILFHACLEIKSIFDEEKKHL